MASRSDENSPPRSDALAKTRRQSTLLDSPSRVTRSQLRRLSCAPEPPASPKPTVTTRQRSVRVSENETTNESVKPASGTAIKSTTRTTRRSVRSVSVEPSENAPAPSKGSKLMSIEEKSMPSVRRTRASIKLPSDPDIEVSLPTTRRTRQSSVSSIASVSTIASSLPSPERRTRSRKKLSPVPSSETSEVQEASPRGRKRTLSSEKVPSSGSPVKHGQSQSLNSSSASTKNSDRSSISIEESSPQRKRTPSLSTPRQLQLDGSDADVFSASPKKDKEKVPVTPDKTVGITTRKSLRSQEKPSLRSRKSSLKSPQFVESPLDDSMKELKLENTNEDVSEENIRLNNEVREVTHLNASGRWSVSSNKEPSMQKPLSPQSSPSKVSEIAEPSLSEVLKSRYSVGSSKSPISTPKSLEPAAEPCNSPQEVTVSTDESQRKLSSGTSKSPSPFKVTPTCELSKIEQGSDSKDVAEDKVMSAVSLKASSVALTPILATDFVQHRASTGNLFYKTESEPKSKLRNSTGSLNTGRHSKSPLKEAVFNFKEKRISVSLPDDGLVTKEREEDEELSPIIQNTDSIEGHNLTLSDISCSGCRQSPNNPFEKSTVLNESVLSSSMGSELVEEVPAEEKSLKLNLSQESEGSTSISNLQTAACSTQSTTPLKKIEVSAKCLADQEDSNAKKPSSKNALDYVSSKVYKDAAFLVSGGDVSDLEDTDSDDNKWQLVFSPSKKSKKERRLEKKEKKRMEKEARKKVKVAHIKTANEDCDLKSQSPVNDLLSNSDQDSNSVADSLPIGADYSSQILNNLNLELFKDDHKDQNVAKASPSVPDKKDHKRKRLSEEMIIGQLDNSFQSKSKDKRKSGASGETSANKDSVNPVIAIEETGGGKRLRISSESSKHSEESISKKKKRNSLNADISFVDELSNVSALSEDTLKKKKKVLAGGMDTLENVDDENLDEERSTVVFESQIKESPHKPAILSDTLLPNETSVFEDGSKKKEKKKKTKDVDGNVNDEFVEKESTVLEAVKILKEKKKKKKTKDVDGVISLSGNVNDEYVEKESTVLEAEKILKKKKKKAKVDIVPENGMTDLSLTGSKILKISKTNGETSSPNSETNQENDSAFEKKKKKKKLKQKELTTTSSQQSPCEDHMEASAEVLKRKQKKKKLKEKNSFEVSCGVDTLPEVVNLESRVALKKEKKKKKKVNEMIVENHDLGNGSDSDEAPAAVSFAAGKEAAMAELQAAAENIRKQKELKRLKLQLKQEKIKEQKLAKMQRMKQKHDMHDRVVKINPVPGTSSADSSSKLTLGGKKEMQKSITKLPKRLPDDLLESLSEQPPSKTSKLFDGSKKIVNEPALTKEEQERLERKRARQLAKRLEKKKLKESEYLPLDGVLGSTRFGVVPLRNVMLAKKLEQNKLAEEAANFRQQTLFGNRIRRTPFTSVLAHQEKLKASGKDRFVVRNSK